MSVDYDFWCLRPKNQVLSLSLRNDQHYLIETKQMHEDIKNAIYAGLDSYELWLADLFPNGKTYDLEEETQTRTTPQHLAEQLSAQKVLYAFVFLKYDEAHYLTQSPPKIFDEQGNVHAPSPFLEDTNGMYIGAEFNISTIENYSTRTLFSLQTIGEASGALMIVPGVWLEKSERSRTDIHRVLHAAFLKMP